MKYLTIASTLFALSTLLTSCTDDVDQVIDFTGIYKGPLNCVGEVHEENGTEAIFTITKLEEGSYSIDLGDEIVFAGKVVGNKLVIDQQTANEGNGFDEVTLEGDFSKTDEGIKAVFEVSVDDEGSSTCDMTLVKQ